MSKARGGLATLGRDIAVSLAFLTRIPAKRLGLGTEEAPDIATAARAFPIAGGLIGAAGGAVLALANALNLPPLAACLLAIAALILLTGGLHEDGLADTADGFGGGRDATKRLAIMRDSRIGSYGALALVLSVGLRASLLAAFLPGAALAGIFALIASEALGRAAIVYNWRTLPPARLDGLAAGIGQPRHATFSAALVLAIGIGLAAGIFAAGLLGAIVALAAAALAATSFASLSLRLIGGHSGDTLGAAGQLTALAALLALVAFR